MALFQVFPCCDRVAAEDRLKVWLAESIRSLTTVLISRVRNAVIGISLTISALLSLSFFHDPYRFCAKVFFLLLANRDLIRTTILTGAAVDPRQQQSRIVALSSGAIKVLFVNSFPIQNVSRQLLVA